MFNWFHRKQTDPLPGRAEVIPGGYPLGTAFLVVEEDGVARIDFRLLGHPRYGVLRIRPAGSWEVIEAPPTETTPKESYGTTTF